MKRQLEREIMDDPDRARVYAEADFSEPNSLFLQLVTDQIGSLANLQLVDLGCGPAEIPIRLVSKSPGLTVTAIDASRPMLKLAQKRLTESARKGVKLVAARLPHLALRSQSCDAVISNSLLHHLPEPLWLWREAARIVRPGGAVVLMDLQRPVSTAAAQAIVNRYAAGEPQLLREDFYNSLLAAFTLDEVKDQVHSFGLDLAVRTASDRHLSVTGRISR